MKKFLSILSILLCSSFSAMENSNNTSSYLQMLEVHAARAKKILCRSEINLADYPCIISLGSIAFSVSAAELSPTSQVVGLCSRNTPIPLDQLPKPNNVTFWYTPDNLRCLKRADLVLAMELLNINKNTESLVTELMKMVKPGGTLITSGAPQHDSSLVKAFSDVSKEPCWQEVFAHVDINTVWAPVDKEETEKILSGKNLKVTKTILHEEPFIYPNREILKTYFHAAMLDWKKEIFNHPVLNDEQQKSEYLDSLIEKYLIYSLQQPDGTIAVSTPQQIYITLTPSEQKKEDPCAIS